MDAFSDRMTCDPRLAAIREKISVVFDARQPETFAAVRLVTETGERLTASHDSDTPEKNPAKQLARLTAKFRSLAEPRIGAFSTMKAIKIVGALEDQSRLRPLMKFCFAPANVPTVTT